MKQNTIGVATLVSLSLLIIPFSYSVAKADTITVPTTCYTFDKNFGRGASDVSSANAVTQLQHFLADTGYFDASLIGSGTFGPRTHEAVVRFQKASGINSTGYVGPLTRNYIRTHCTNPGTSPVSLYTISPSAGAVGTTVSVTGFGFTNNNTILMDGSVVARNVPITSSIAVACTTDPSCKGGIRQTLTFTVPSSLSPNCPTGSMCPMYMRLVTPGSYTVTINNENGTSEGKTFVVTDSSTTNPLSISSLDAHTTLPIGVSGTWTVHVSTNTSAGTLHYSIRWGDEVAYQSATAFRAPDTQPLPTTATFTHTYSNTGTYTPTFIVTDDAGRSVSSSTSILVTPIY